MRRILFKLVSAVAVCTFAVLLFIALRERNGPRNDARSYRSSWSNVAAASYLESREVWWQKWPSAQMDHGTVCVSCHTVVPYAMVQPKLRKQLGENEMTAPERAMLTSIEKRVTEWTQMSPYYSDSAGPGKAAESRSTESVLNAMILSNYDAAEGHLRPVTRMAFDEAWKLQETNGANAGGWKWQNFHLAPWESNESAYQGAALFGVVLGNAPDSYMNDDGVRENVDRLRQYLQRSYSSQSVMTQLYVLWASANMPGLLSESDRTALIARVENLQRPDGGWALSSMDGPDGWKKILKTRFSQLIHARRSDGCATGLAVLALQAGAAGSNQVAVQRGLEWLKQHQHEDGSWWADSLNGLNEQDSDTALFMQDAATGYAVLALEAAGAPGATAGVLRASPADPETARY